MKRRVVKSVAGCGMQGPSLQTGENHTYRHNSHSIEQRLPQLSRVLRSSAVVGCIELIKFPSTALYCTHHPFVLPTRHSITEVRSSEDTLLNDYLAPCLLNLHHRCIELLGRRMAVPLELVKAAWLEAADLLHWDSADLPRRPGSGSKLAKTSHSQQGSLMAEKGK